MRRSRFGRPSSLSLLTWNVWFGLDRPHRRWTKLLEIVGKLRPDVIGFQEVTEPFLHALRTAGWRKRGYWISDPHGEEIDRYGSIVVSRLPIERTAVHPLESQMGRRLVVVETTVADRPWAFATVHLESLSESAAVRGLQLENIIERLERFENVVLMGDFNFCSSWPEEEERIPDTYLDLWREVRPGEDGFTVDCARNPMRLREVPGWKRVRFDRILVRSEHLQPAEVQLVGVDRIRCEGPTLLPSDHFGLWGRIE
jgi:endonuclease/exonuclease/phosphatase family metal-dependent hydrolase